ncbi:hypothetical protein PanWU01x14_371170, partial [Parasponia andersonii]
MSCLRRPVVLRYKRLPVPLARVRHYESSQAQTSQRPNELALLPKEKKSTSL